MEIFLSITGSEILRTRLKTEANPSFNSFSKYSECLTASPVLGVGDRAVNKTKFPPSPLMKLTQQWENKNREKNENIANKV